jgi:hypothetical protein
MSVRQLLCSRHCGLTVNAVMTLADGAGFAGELVTSATRCPGHRRLGCVVGIH